MLAREWEFVWEKHWDCWKENRWALQWDGTMVVALDREWVTVLEEESAMSARQRDER